MSFLKTIKSKFLTLVTIKKIKKLDKNKPLIVIFFPDIDIVNGGILSLNSIYKYITQYKKNHHILCSFIKIKQAQTFRKYTQFNCDFNLLPIKVTLKYILNFNEIIFFIPELYVKDFNDLHRDYANRKEDNIFNSNLSFWIHILNQNDLLMPDDEEISYLKSNFNDISISVAHKKYYNKNLKYNLPLYHLPAWLNDKDKYDSSGYEQKQNIIAISPDDMEKLSAIRIHSKDELIQILKNSFPDFSIVVIQNMSYNDYKKFIYKIKYLITLGEGLDGYFIEAAMSGSVPFAIKNNVFFDLQYLELPNLFENYEDLYDGVVSRIKILENDITLYNKYNNLPRSIILKDYNYTHYKNKMHNLIIRNF